jgi:HemY protein
MIRLLWRFAILLAAALLFAWLADRPGSVTITWLGREIHMSVLVAVAIGLTLLFALSFAWQLLRRIWRSPTAAREFWRFRQHRKAYESLSKGIIAAGAGDAQAAARHAAIAGNTLADEPLVNVLAAQAAQLKGDREGVKRIFEEMTKSPETELMGLRGLFSEARQTGDLVAALHHAEKALAKNPRLPWASTAVLQVQAARKLWLPAAQTLEQQGRSGLLSREAAAPKRAAMLTAEAIACEDQDRTRALDLASDAHKLDPALVPAASVIARCHIASGNTRKAQKVLRATWERARHPDLAELMARSVTGDGPEARFERVRDLVGSTAEDVESAHALARAALAARRLDVARTALSVHLADRPQARICALMGEVEDAEGDKGKAREWFARAIHAPRDPMWVSDGVASPRWLPVSPVTGEIVPCEWKVPFDMLPAAADDEISSEAQNLPAISVKLPEGDPAKALPFQRPPDDPGVDAADRVDG